MHQEASGASWGDPEGLRAILGIFFKVPGDLKGVLRGFQGDSGVLGGFRNI